MLHLMTKVINLCSKYRSESHNTNLTVGIDNLNCLGKYGSIVFDKNKFDKDGVLPYCFGSKFDKDKTIPLLESSDHIDVKTGYMVFNMFSSYQADIWSGGTMVTCQGFKYIIYKGLIICNGNPLILLCAHYNQDNIPDMIIMYVDTTVFERTDPFSKWFLINIITKNLLFKPSSYVYYYDEMNNEYIKKKNLQVIDIGDLGFFRHTEIQDIDSDSIKEYLKEHSDEVVEGIVS